MYSHKNTILIHFINCKIYTTYLKNSKTTLEKTVGNIPVAI